MLDYFSYGKRRYHENPHVGQRRLSWEFQAVLSGSIMRTDRDGFKKSDLKTRTLWFSPPGAMHGWSGEAGQDATIVVFHFRYVPEVVKQAMVGSAGVSIDLSRSQCRRLKELAEQTTHYWNQPSVGMMLGYENALMELSILVHESLSTRSDQPAQPTSDRVQSAVLWYSEHLHENPKLDDVARAVHVSKSHLRRLFYECFESSPKHVFDQIRFQRVMQLLTDTEMKLGAVARACGFEEQSVFSRAFKNRFKCSPSALRLAERTL